ncbi:hypothetical protein LPH46_04585 [Xylella taiwanensis]|nr:hypothetical protein [Xylella taiwanensis]UFN30239.1 hypothetical protein LPH46_04585 [Xylella taiwanensis]
MKNTGDSFNTITLHQRRMGNAAVTSLHVQTGHPDKLAAGFQLTTDTSTAPFTIISERNLSACSLLSYADNTLGK